MRENALKATPSECETFCFKLKGTKIASYTIKSDAVLLSFAAALRKDKRLQECKEMKSKLERERERGGVEIFVLVD